MEQEFFDTEYETTPQTDEPQEDNSKIDRYADMFTATIITLAQLILAAVLVAFGLSAVPAFSFNLEFITRTFVLLLGIKSVLAAYKIKLL